MHTAMSDTGGVIWAQEERSREERTVVEVQQSRRGRVLVGLATGRRATQYGRL
jgi:hypothetical protein